MKRLRVRELCNLLQDLTTGKYQSWNLNPDPIFFALFSLFWVCPNIWQSLFQEHLFCLSVGLESYRLLVNRWSQLSNTTWASDTGGGFEKSSPACCESGYLHAQWGPKNRSTGDRHRMSSSGSRGVTKSLFLLNTAAWGLGPFLFGTGSPSIHNWEFRGDASLEEGTVLLWLLLLLLPRRGLTLQYVPRELLLGPVLRMRRTDEASGWFHCPHD